MSTVTNTAFSFSRLLAGALVAATVGMTATIAAAAGQTPVGISEPGYLPQARALLRSAPATSGAVELQTQSQENRENERPKAAWEDCEPGTYWMMEGVDYSTPMRCR